MMLRIVEGSIKNASDAHGVTFDPYFARSVAKRAVGTLSAAMPSVLAAKPSEKLGVATELVMSARAARKAQVAKPSGGPTFARPKAGAVPPAKTAPLRSLEKWMFQQMRGIKNEGHTEYAQAFIDVLRKIAAMKTVDPP